MSIITFINDKNLNDNITEHNAEQKETKDTKITILHSNNLEGNEKANMLISQRIG